MNRAWILIALSLLAPGTTAQAADLTVRQQVEIDPLCGDRHVLARIMERFAWAEQNTWRRGFEMASLLNPRLRHTDLDGPSLISRVYCQADAQMTNQLQHTVYYAIEAEMGFASVGNGIDFCVLGLDPWYVHDDACRTVR
jgi:hypothetical protein